MPNQHRNRPRVIVIGAGFGGMQTAQSLARSGAEVLLIDRQNYNTFVPLLYQVAAAQLAPEAIAYPIRTILRKAPQTRFLRAEVQRVDYDQKIVETDRGALTYDYLVIATGSQTQYLGVPGAAEYGFALRTLDQANALRNHLLHCLEEASSETDPVRRQQLLTVVVVGGGPTGVEVAGTLVEFKRSLRRDYPGVNLDELQILLIQSGANLLKGLPDRLGRYTTRKLRQMGVLVSLDMRVSRISESQVELQDGTLLFAETVIWTAGLEAALPEASTNLAKGRQQKLRVRSTLQLIDHANVYAIGDVAAVEQKGKSLSGVAPEALQQGVAVARNIRRQLQGQAPKPFHYFNKGRLAIIGGYAGVGKIGPFLLTGFLPWLMWLSVHLVYLPGFRNRLIVLLSWLHAYGWGDRAVRLLLGKANRQQPRPSTLVTG